MGCNCFCKKAKGLKDPDAPAKLVRAHLSLPATEAYKYIFTVSNFVTLLLVGLVLFGLDALFNVVMAAALPGLYGDNIDDIPLDQLKQEAVTWQELLIESAINVCESVAFLAVFAPYFGRAVILSASSRFARLCSYRNYPFDHLDAIDRNKYKGSEGLVPMLFGGLKHLKTLVHLMAFFLMAMVMVFVGFFCLIVPGILIALSLSIGPAIIVLEGHGPIEAMKRSFQVLRHKKRRTFFFWLLYAILAILSYAAVIIVVILINLAFDAAETGGSEWPLAVASIIDYMGISFVTMLYWACTATYYHYCHIKDAIHSYNKDIDAANVSAGISSTGLQNKSEAMELSQRISGHVLSDKSE